jgi:hypothetical protein
VRRGRALSSCRTRPRHAGLDPASRFFFFLGSGRREEAGPRIKSGVTVQRSTNLEAHHRLAPPTAPACALTNRNICGTEKPSSRPLGQRKARREICFASLRGRCGNGLRAYPSASAEQGDRREAIRDKDGALRHVASTAVSRNAGGGGKAVRGFVPADWHEGRPAPFADRTLPTGGPKPTGTESAKPLQPADRRRFSPQGIERGRATRPNRGRGRWARYESLDAFVPEYQSRPAPGVRGKDAPVAPPPLPEARETRACRRSCGWAE